MNKSDLINAMAAEAQMSKADAKKALDAFVTSVTNAMKAGEKVSLVGFGTFSVSERAERTGAAGNLVGREGFSGKTSGFKCRKR